MKPESQNPNAVIGKVRGGWRWKDRKIHNLSRDTCTGPAGLIGNTPPPPAGAGVRAFIVAMKPGNAGGAKGRREMDA